MALALIVAVGSVALGAALGLYRRAGPLLGAIRTFALVAALVVVLVELLPDALGKLGLWALVITAAAAFLPTVLARFYPGNPQHGHGHGHAHGHGHGLSAQGPGGHTLGLELGYVGLLLHKLGDGASLAAFTHAGHEGHNHYDVLLAIGAHTVPITALVVLAYATEHGWRHAIGRAFGLAAATAIGVAAVQILPFGLADSAHPWLAAIVGGLLLHVVAHDWSPGESRNRRAPLELAGLALGLSLLLLPGAHDHGDGAGEIRHAAGDAFVDLTLDTAPTLLLGLLIGAGLQLLGGRIPMRWLTHGSSLRQAMRGAIVGAPLPICACGVLPVAQSLRLRGGSAALVVAFLLSTPELGVETFALTARFLGWEMAFVRLFAAVTVAIVAALIVASVARRDPTNENPSRPSEMPISDDDMQKPWPRRLLDQLDELLEHIGPWTLVGLIAAAYVEATLTPDALTGFDAFGLDVLLVSLVAVPSYVCAASATPLAAVLIAKGMSPGAVLAGLLLGPATNLATVGFLRAHFGGRATAVGLGGLIATVWVIAVALNASPVTIEPMPASHGHAETRWLAWAATAILVALALRAIGRDGLAGWMGALSEGLGDPDRPEGDDHAHGHGHGH